MLQHNFPVIMAEQLTLFRATNLFCETTVHRFLQVGNHDSEFMVASYTISVAKLRLVTSALNIPCLQCDKEFFANKILT